MMNKIYISAEFLIAYFDRRIEEKWNLAERAKQFGKEEEYQYYRGKAHAYTVARDFIEMCEEHMDYCIEKSCEGDDEA